MTKDINHEIELYLLETFNALLEYEVRRSRRYKHPLTLVYIALQVEPDVLETRRAAEVAAIQALDTALRDSDVPCLDGHEFRVLLPSTNDRGARSACNRLEKRLNRKDQTQDGLSFHMSALIGFTTSPEDEVLSTDMIKEQAGEALARARRTQSSKAISFLELK